ncbi:hypothetical protein P152DRAFT_453663 [Eremomyces bilateralis CBS 781.70]|uniref:tRNA wybutosine-synthesizing protein 2 n=1 Tax=Eremomyces bilateralis CBS 781.70 TaxID=1392243 RepID=A0A6G1GGK1_9PEZI|nr:uncharacterized protein P152DRAFT_453663 [Eremomyces bilateralis CBS 781.70]KAF1817056.1 hypothetical protein P152DRAFT_453663 [Eremomyces bilateralis CBS 781.70]
MTEDANLCRSKATICSDNHSAVAKSKNVGSHKRSIPGPVSKAVQRWILQVQSSIPGSIEIDRIDPLPLVNALSRYTVYGSLLSVRPGLFETGAWGELFNAHQSVTASSFYRILAEELRVTHIAYNGTIPATQSKYGEEEASNDFGSGLDQSQATLLRIPAKIQPLYGYFGPLEDNTTANTDRIRTWPNHKALPQTFFATVQQFGISYVFPPIHCMFSRGNTREKERLLNLPAIQSAVHEGQAAGTGCAAVDLYAGIGYFSFCYAKAGVDTILAWEVNGWSVEAFRRGAVQNKWECKIISLSDDDPVLEEWRVQDHEDEKQSSAPRLVMFHQSNEYAADELERTRHMWPPIRHVNCGYLPSSGPSWSAAVKALDPKLGGWLHLHENVKQSDIEAKARDVVVEIRKLFDAIKAQRGSISSERERSDVQLEHIERVKSFAPGIYHCVFDIWVSGT